MTKARFFKLRTALAILVTMASCGRAQDVSTSTREDRSTVAHNIQLTFHETSMNPVDGWTRMDFTRDGKVGIWVDPTPSFTLKDIKSAKPGKDPQGHDGLTIELTETGTPKARSLSSSQLGKNVAILLDGRLISAPVVKGQFGPPIMITGLEAEDIERIIAGVRQK